eukprot:gene20575-biopygen17588
MNRRYAFTHEGWGTNPSKHCTIWYAEPLPTHLTPLHHFSHAAACHNIFFNSRTISWSSNPCTTPVQQLLQALLFASGSLLIGAPSPPAYLASYPAHR